jgi:hypothetical protein
LGGSGNHPGNDDTILCKVAKSLEPTCAIVQESIPLEKGCVEGVCVINKLLKVFQCNDGRAPQILKEVIETAGPVANNYVVLVRYIS